MKISYKNIKTIRKKPQIVDHYYGLTINDFLDDEDIADIEQTRIYWKLKRAQEKRLSNE